MKKYIKYVSTEIISVMINLFVIFIFSYTIYYNLFKVSHSDYIIMDWIIFSLFITFLVLTVRILVSDLILHVSSVFNYNGLEEINIRKYNNKDLKDLIIKFENANSNDETREILKEIIFNEALCIYSAKYLDEIINYQYRDEEHNFKYRYFSAGLANNADSFKDRIVINNNNYIAVYTNFKEIGKSSLKKGILVFNGLNKIIKNIDGFVINPNTDKFIIDKSTIMKFTKKHNAA